MTDAESTGVYLIHNTANGKNYVGSAAGSFKSRLENHVYRLRGGYHGNQHLQRAWNKYGESAFEFFILEMCSREDCVSREQYWIDYYESATRELGYNISPTAGSSLGVKHSPETIANMSAAMQKIRGDISLRMMGNQNGVGPKGPCSQEKKDKIAATLTGRKLTDEHRENLKKTSEQLEKMRLRQTGKKYSDELKKKMSEAQYEWRSHVRHVSAKLTDDQVNLIRSLHSQGMSQRKIAKTIGIGRSSVSLILQGKTYKPLV